MPDPQTDQERGSLLFSLWVAVLLIVTLPIMWLALAIAPAGRRTHQLVRRFSRAIIGLSLCELRVRGTEHLDEVPCAVLVANHSSYLDSVALLAAIPRDCRMVVNHMAAGRPLVGLIIRKAGHVVVDRRSRQSRMTCGRTMIETLQRGTSLLLFPEGTRAEGARALSFQPGAFRAAARAECPVIPVAITGTRRILPRRIRLLRRSRIDVSILAAIRPDDRTVACANRLRDSAAAAIADVLRARDAGVFDKR